VRLIFDLVCDKDEVVKVPTFAKVPGFSIPGAEGTPLKNALAENRN
jgi:hypothetical protein